MISHNLLCKKHFHRTFFNDISCNIGQNTGYNGYQQGGLGGLGGLGGIGGIGGYPIG